MDVTKYFRNNCSLLSCQNEETTDWIYTNWLFFRVLKLLMILCRDTLLVPLKKIVLILGKNSIFHISSLLLVSPKTVFRKRLKWKKSTAAEHTSRLLTTLIIIFIASTTPATLTNRYKKGSISYGTTVIWILVEVGENLRPQ